MKIPRRCWRTMLRAVLASTAVLAALAGPWSAGGSAAAAGSAAPAAAAQPITTSPEVGVVGTPITVSASGLPANRPVQLYWGTVDGAYQLNASAENVEYWDRQFSPSRLRLGEVRTDAAGRLSAVFPIPEDYGETHDVIAVLDGQDVARGGVAVTRTATISASEGPIGTAITIDVKGLGWSSFSNTMAVMYDNTFTGFVSAVTTRGTAQARLRAAGAVGQHEIRVTDASGAVPYLNTEQSPRKLPQFKFTFTVTGDRGQPDQVIDQIDPSRLGSTEGMVKTTASGAVPAPGVSAAFAPSRGPILSTATLSGSGFPAGASLDLLWVSALGNRVRGGWDLIQTPAGSTTAGADGAISAPIQVPDGLGGWHHVQVVQGERVLAEVPFFVERSLVTVSPARVRAGDVFKVEIKGVGWTELDNGVAVTYDNAYVGYACGFNSNGDVTLFLTANGAPGTHLIDLYPMLFRVADHGMGPWDYYVPQLTFARDHPSLALGYDLPAFRLAITVE